MSAFTTARLKDAIVAAGVAVTDVAIGSLADRATWRVSPANLQGSAQATIDGFVDSPDADAAWLNLSDRAAAQTAIDTDTSAMWKAERAAAAVLVDEINTIRDWVTSFKAATAGAATLAAFKTAVAALPDLPDRTLAQAKTAIKAKIAAGTVD